MNEGKVLSVIIKPADALAILIQHLCGWIPSIAAR
jgi:hypothetical protein